MIGEIRDAMVQDKKETQVAKGMVDGLEPYRRLIELQKQMIDLVRQHEKTKRECTTLRAQLLEEMTRSQHSRRGFYRRIHRPVATWLKRLAAFWKSRVESRPQPNGSFLPRNPLLKI